MQCILYMIYFLKVFHMYYNLICIFYALLFARNFVLIKSGCYNFIVGLPLTARKFDLIWVIVDRLSKSAHFIPIHTRYDARRYAEIYIARVLCLHGVPKMIVSDQGLQFVGRFWEQLHTSLRTHLIHSSAHHPQMDGQTE
jgi:hypothetical protein